jgi:hypothetical protein
MHLLDVGRNVLAKNLENAALPNEDKILDAALATLG